LAQPVVKARHGNAETVCGNCGGEKIRRRHVES
jgi:hypothetical protein